jgi:DNA repair ATPase RecN
MAKVKSVTVTNLKAISSLSADFNGATIILTGGNDKGKSSFLRSLPDRIRGIKPETVVKHGEKEGQAEWVLDTGEKFIWKFTEDKERLTYVSERDIRSAVTKDIVARYFPPTFDVDRFLQDGPAKQKAALQKMVGIDFTEIDSQYKVAYDERTWANRKLVEEKAKAKTVNDTLPDAEVSYDAHQTALDGIDEHNNRIKGVEDGLKTRRQLIDQYNDTIAGLEAQIKAIRDKMSPIQQQITDGLKWLENSDNEPISDDNKQVLVDKIAEIKEQNRLITDNNKARETQKALAAAQQAADKADEDVTRIEAEKLAMIQNAKMPDGFGFNEDGITYNGFPFDKKALSSSSIYIAALKLAAMTLGEVRTLYFDASYLDFKSLEEIEKWAQTQNLQLLIEMPDRSGGEISYEIINNTK